VAVAGQSGGMTIYIVHALTNHNIGVSKALGMGNRCVVDFDEVVDYLGKDDETKLIALYIEGLDQPRRLMRVAAAVSRKKPILALKGGRSGINHATLSHTGALAGEDRFYQAAFHQAGIVQVQDTTELVDMAKALTKQPPARGNRIAVLSVQAGPGIVIADKCRRMGLALAQFSEATRERLREVASPMNSIENPVDVAWANQDYEACVHMMRCVLEDENVGGMIAASLHFPPGADFFRAVIEVAADSPKPITVCMDSPLGESYVEWHIMQEQGLPVFPLPERAVTGMAGLVRWGRAVQKLVI
jgi:acyl-CoA synthetase (NDP forming)